MNSLKGKFLASKNGKINKLLKKKSMPTKFSVPIALRVKMATTGLGAQHATSGGMSIVQAMKILEHLYAMDVPNS